MTSPIERRKLPYDAFTDCWYVPGETHIVDLIHPDDGLTLHYREDETQVRARYPNAQRLSCEDAWKAADAVGTARYRQDITEVTAERFNDALNVLPPVGWTTRQGIDSFRISERIWGSITDIYARLGDRFFKLSDDIRLSPDIVVERVRAFVVAHPEPTIGTAPVRPADAATERGPSPSPAPGDDR
jgi:hypothetical protein